MRDIVKFVLSKINSERLPWENIYQPWFTIQCFLCEGFKMLPLKLHDFAFKYNVYALLILANERGRFSNRAPPLSLCASALNPLHLVTHTTYPVASHTYRVAIFHFVVPATELIQFCN
jgi:hypothetical protein